MQGRALNAGLCAQYRAVRSMQSRTFNARPACHAQRNAGLYVSMQGRILNSGPYSQCRAARPLKDRTLDTWLHAELSAARPNAGPLAAQYRAVRSMKSRTLNAGLCAQCRVVRSMQGRTLNAGPCAPSRASRTMQGVRAQTQKTWAPEGWGALSSATNGKLCVCFISFMTARRREVHV